MNNNDSGVYYSKKNLSLTCKRLLTSILTNEPDPIFNNALIFLLKSDINYKLFTLDCLITYLVLINFILKSFYGKVFFFNNPALGMGCCALRELF